MKDIRSMSPKERNEKIIELRAELVRLNTLVAAGGSVENPTKIREIRKTLARILTIENENDSRLAR
jgi:large subunit ribosomal protein L29